MEQSYQVLPAEKSKKSISLRSFLDAKKIDKTKIQEYFLENCSNIPQELRLVVWKIILGISSSFHNQNASLDKILVDHYNYLKRLIDQVFQMQTSKHDELNYFIYLLDRDHLPLENNPQDNQDGNPFSLIYKQLTEILDDQYDFESYFLTTEIYEFLQKNLSQMKIKFTSCLSAETVNKQSIEQINIDPFLSCGLAGLFNDVKMYHIIWDRLVMGEFELLVFVLLSFLESCKDEQLRSIKSLKYSQFNSIRKFGLDEVKILKKTTKFYKNLHTNPQISNLIVNYLNSK